MEQSSEKHVQGKIIWAVDPLTEERGLHAKLVKLIQNFRGPGTIVEPVYVLSPDQLEMRPGFFASNRIDLKKAMEQRLKTWAVKFQLKGVLAPTLIISNESSLRSSVSALLVYARETGAKAIAAASHSRRGVKRLALGSFAESLVLQSEIPVLLVTPRTKAVDPIERVLFSTDVSAASEHAFEELLNNLGHGVKELILFNAAEFSTDCMILEYGTSPVYLKCLQEEVDRRRETLEKWVGKAQSRGIKGKVIVLDTPGDIPGRMMAIASSNHCDLIALASQDGTLAAALKGSISRRTIRTATSPLWMAHVKTDFGKSVLAHEPNTLVKGAVTA